MNSTTQNLIDSLDTDELTDALTGRKGGLRPSKPTAHSGLVQYVWRMARFHAGADPKMPVTATWWLQDHLDEEGIDVSVTGVLDEDGKALLAALDDVTDEVLANFGHDSTAGARRWKKAGAL